MVPLLAWIFVQASADPVAGVWEGYYKSQFLNVENNIVLELQREGRRVTGTVVTEADRLPIENGTFDEGDHSIRFEIYFSGTRQRYRAEGKIATAGQMRGTWKHDEDFGTFEFRRSASKR